MAREGGRVQLEQSDMCLALKIAKMAKGGCSRASIQERQYQITKRQTEAREVKKWRLESPCHNTVKAVIETHPAMLRQTHPKGCLRCHNRTATDLQTYRRHKEQVHLRPTDTDSWHEKWQTLCPERHPHHSVTMRELKVPKFTICLLDVCIDMLLIPTLNLSMCMHMPRIASTIKFIIQICSLMMEHPLVSTLSAVW